MDITTLIIAVALSLSSGGAIAWILASKKYNKAKVDLASREQQLQMLEEKLSDTEEKVISLDNELDQSQQEKTNFDKANVALTTKQQSSLENIQRLQLLNDDLSNKVSEALLDASDLKAEIAKFTSTQKERDQSHDREMTRFKEQSEVLKNEFEIISNKLFEAKSKSLTENNKSTLDELLKPFKEQITGFQQRVNEIHSESIKNTSSLDAEIKNMLKIGMKMSDEANNLTSALKGDSQQRGAWGEAQLERTLEMSGLVESTHFEKQPTYKDSKGKSKKPDYVVKLPDNKHIIIDSKVSLVAYDRAIAAETPELEQLALNEHAAAVKARIDELAEKDYTNLIGVSSPSFVLMFVPIEPAYIDALKHDKDLFGYGYEQNIVLVSHTTLIPILRTVANLWMMERSNTDAREISEKAGDIFNSVCTVAERLKKLGNTLNTVSSHYNDTVTAIAGQQGLKGKVERFNQLSNKISKSMPDLDTKHLDFETEKLALIAEPIEDISPEEDDD